jgi:hypothetical protein
MNELQVSHQIDVLCRARCSVVGAGKRTADEIVDVEVFEDTDERKARLKGFGLGHQ